MWLVLSLNLNVYLYNVTNITSKISSKYIQQCLIQPGQLLPCTLSVLDVLHHLFSFFSPVQLFAVTERSSISQAPSCLNDELPQRYDSRSHAHWYFCFLLHRASKVSAGEFENTEVRNAALLTLSIFRFIFESQSLFFFSTKMQSECQ